MRLLLWENSAIRPHLQLLEDDWDFANLDPDDPSERLPDDGAARVPQQVPGMTGAPQRGVELVVFQFDHAAAVRRHERAEHGVAGVVQLGGQKSVPVYLKSSPDWVKSPRMATKVVEYLIVK